MLTVKIWLGRLNGAANRLNRFKNRGKALRKHAFVTVITLALSFMTVFLMTGVLFFKNDVLITADNVTKKYFTMNEDSEEILTEFGYTVGEYDRVFAGEDDDGYNRIDVIRGFGVEITADGSTFTKGAIPGETYTDILGSCGITVGEFDAVITNDNMINVVRGFGVNVKADGNSVKVSSNETTGQTVSAVLQNADIVVGEGDIIILQDKDGRAKRLSADSQDEDATVSEGDEVIVKRVTYRERTGIEKVPYETNVQYDNLMAMGESVVEEGEEGEITFVFYEKLVDGEVVTSEVLSKEHTKEPKTEQITRGTALKTPYCQLDFPEIRLENGIPVEYTKVISGKATAYTAPPTSGTASGRKLQIGTVAIDPNIIPYGSLLYIVSSNGNEVYGAAIAADTGGFAHNGSGVLIDLFMGLTSEHYDDACRWGVRNVDVYVINTGVY